MRLIMSIEPEEIKKILTRKKINPISSKDMLSTGSVLLNLALSGRPDVGYMKGGYYIWTGGSTSGKTFGVLYGIAEAALNPSFDDYRLILDNPENGSLMDKERFFGSRF